MENEDLLDLCRLNQMEDTISKDEGCDTVYNKDEVTEVKKYIRFKIKNLANKIIRNTQEVLYDTKKK